MIKVIKKTLPDYVEDKNEILNNKKFINCLEHVDTRVYRYLYSPSQKAYITRFPKLTEEIINFIADENKTDKEKKRHLEFEFTYDLKLSDKQSSFDNKDVDKDFESYNEMFKNEDFVRILKTMGVYFTKEKITTNYHDILKDIVDDYNNGLLEILEETQKQTTYRGNVDPYYRTSTTTYIQD